jgi:hypothetical protein
MAVNRTLEEELGEMTDDPGAEIWAPPPTPLPNFENISLVVPKRKSARRQAWIAGRVEFLLGAYRRDDFNNPAHFASTCVQMLEQYPDCVIENATSPRSGLQTKVAFAPNPAELRDFCDRSLRSYSAICLNNARKRRVAEAAERPKQVVPVKSETIEQIRARNVNLDYILAGRMKANQATEKARWIPPTLADLAAKNGANVTPEQIAAIPEFKEKTTFHRVKAPPIAADASTNADQEELTKEI